MLIVLSGPSGVGKDAVLKRMKELGHPFHYAITATTRNQRRGERDGVDYWFISEERFGQMVDNRDMLEWARVYDYHYGVPKSEVEPALAQGQDVIVKVDVQGAATIKGLLPQAVSIFLVPSTMEELAQRLGSRHTEGSDDLKLRQGKAIEEMERLPMFDYVVVNHQDRVDLAVSHIQAIVTAEKCRTSPRVIEPSPDCPQKVSEEPT